MREPSVKERISLTVVAIVLTVCAVMLAFMKQTAETGCTAALAGLFALIAYRDCIAELSIGPAGIKAKMKRLEIEVRELQEVLCALARSTFTGIFASGRMGGVPDEIEQGVVDRLILALKKLNVSSEALDEALKEARLYTKFDYAHYLLGGNRNPKDDRIRAAKQNLHSDGLQNIPTADQIERFFRDFDLLTEERMELLEDYRYYEKNHEHRRPDVWADRTDWPHLDDI